MEEFQRKIFSDFDEDNCILKELKQKVIFIGSTVNDGEIIFDKFKK